MSIKPDHCYSPILRVFAAGLATLSDNDCTVTAQPDEDLHKKVLLRNWFGSDG